jgi:hypothetical protein
MSSRISSTFCALPSAMRPDQICPDVQYRQWNAPRSAEHHSPPSHQRWSPPGRRSPQQALWFAVRCQRRIGHDRTPSWCRSARDGRTMRRARSSNGATLSCVSTLLAGPIAAISSGTPSHTSASRGMDRLTEIARGIVRRAPSACLNDQLANCGTVPSNILRKRAGVYATDY